MSNSYRTSLKPTLIVTGIYAMWALGASTSLGTGGMIIFVPVVAVATFVAHNMLRWMIR